MADIGAGTGLFDVPIGKAVAPNGRVYAIEIDKDFFPMIRKRAADAHVDNIETVLGQFTDPMLPVKNIDVALFHDVMHHIEKRADYINALNGISGRTAASSSLITSRRKDRTGISRSSRCHAHSSPPGCATQDSRRPRM